MKGTLSALMVFGIAVAGCGHGQPTAPKYTAPVAMATAATLDASGAAANAVTASGVNSAGNVKGAAGEMPAFYDGKLFTINSVEISDVAADHVGENSSHNEIFVTNDLDDPQDFFPVLDAIQGDGFNPLWEQFLIVFNPGVPPHQFHSDDEVHNAAAGANPEITLVDTGEMYRCSVVTAKK